MNTWSTSPILWPFLKQWGLACLRTWKVNETTKDFPPILICDAYFEGLLASSSMSTYVNPTMLNWQHFWRVLGIRLHREISDNNNNSPDPLNRIRRPRWLKFLLIIILEGTMAEGHMGDDEDLTHEVNSFQDWHFLNRGRAMGTTSCFRKSAEGRVREG